MKKQYKGDGFLFHKAVKDSAMTVAEIIDKSDLTMGTLYRLYDKEKLNDDEKAAAAKALGKEIEDIFTTEHEPGAKKTESDDKKDEKSGSKKTDIDLSSTKTTSNMDERLMNMLQQALNQNDKHLEISKTLTETIAELAHRVPQPHQYEQSKSKAS